MKTKTFLLFIAFALILSSCSQSISIMNYSSENYVSLCNYQCITVEKTYLEISYSEVESIIETELSANEIYTPVLARSIPEPDDIVLLSVDEKKEYYFVGSDYYSEELEQALLSMHINETQTLETKIGTFAKVKLEGIYRHTQTSDTDIVLGHYGYDSFEELSAFIRQRAREEILSNYALDIILEQSKVFALPEELKYQLTLDIQTSKDYILEEYATFEEYLEENAITEEEFEEQIASWYYEPMIYKAILDAEGVAITDADLNLYQDENQLVECDQYEIYSQLAQQKVREILLSTVQITE